MATRGWWAIGCGERTVKMGSIPKELGGICASSVLDIREVQMPHDDCIQARLYRACKSFYIRIVGKSKMYIDAQV
jgi:hypothetical protein